HPQTKFFPYTTLFRSNNNMYKQTILDKILNRDNLNDAYKQVSKNKGSAGSDGMTIDEAGGYLAENKAEIVEAIRKRKYKPQPVLDRKSTRLNSSHVSI